MMRERNNHIDCACGNLVQHKTKNCPQCGLSMQEIIEYHRQRYRPDDF